MTVLVRSSVLICCLEFVIREAAPMADSDMGSKKFAIFVTLKKKKKNIYLSTIVSLVWVKKRKGTDHELKQEISLVHTNLF